MTYSNNIQHSYSLPLPLTWLQPCDFPHKLGICERLFGNAIAPQGICWVKTGAGIPWKLDLTNPTHRWIVYGKYEGAAFLNWAQKFLPPKRFVAVYSSHTFEHLFRDDALILAKDRVLEGAGVVAEGIKS